MSNHLLAMRLIAHRGGAGLRVENTLAAFENAIELGAHGAELDVHLTRDGKVVVHHDDRLYGAGGACEPDSRKVYWKIRSFHGPCRPDGAWQLAQ